MTFLFFKYINDLYKYDADKIKINIPDQASYQFIYENRNNRNLGELLNASLKSIDEENKFSELNGLFKEMDYTLEKVFGHIDQQDKILRILLEEFQNIKLDPEHIDTKSLGKIYRRLIENFPMFNLKETDLAPTPESLSSLIAQLVEPQPKDKIHDPTAGFGSLLIRVAEEVKDNNFSLYAQEKNKRLYVLLKMNAIINGMSKNIKSIQWGDVLTNPLIIENEELMRFNVVVAHPSFSIRVDEHENYITDTYKRFKRGTPPASKADYAFISHIVSTMDDTTGRAAVIIPNGVLFRGGNEEIIRKALIEEEIIDAVIGLPSKLIYGTSIPITILILKKNRNKGDVLFIDASNYFTSKNTTINVLNEEHIKEITNVYKNYESKLNFSFVANKQKIRENNYNLNIPRYVDIIEEETKLNEEQISNEINYLEDRISKIQEQLREHLLEIRYLEL